MGDPQRSRPEVAFVRNRIGGELCDASDGAMFERRNPADSRSVVSVAPESTSQDVRDAVGAARDAFPAWAALGPSARGAYLERAADLLAERAEATATELVREEGKPLAAATGEAKRTPRNLRLYAGEALRLTGTTFPSDDSEATVMTQVEPLGVVGVITPWNFPLNLPSRKLSPALAAGNTVVFKPSPLTPLMGERLAAAFADADLPPGVLNVVHGSAAGAHLVGDERVDAITFTGSTETGAKIHDAIGLGRRVQLELGGKNPIVVLDDADLDAAADAVARSSFSLTGQACTGAGRVLAHESIHDELVERLVALAEDHVLGDGLHDAVTMGPVVDEPAMDAILAAVEQAQTDGAKLVTGGAREASTGLEHGWFLPATVFVDVDPRSALAQEEVFGPVIGVERVTSLDDAISRANDVRYGLTAAICTRDVGAALRFSRTVQAGMVKVNRPTVGAAINAPFGGFKLSGTATHKEQLGPTVMDFYTRQRTILLADLP